MILFHGSCEFTVSLEASHLNLRRCYIMEPVDSQESDGKMDAKSRRRPLGAFYKCIRALSPIPYLIRARDYYVRGITQCAGMGSYVGIAGAPGATMALPQSFIFNSSSLRGHDDDYRELIRAASQRGRATTTKLSDHQPFPRSFSTSTDHRRRQQIVVGRIDEDSPCYFSGSFRKTVDEDLRFPRSRSCSSVANLNPHERKKIAV
uniref:Uncharacterized protein n=2 Tax=Picea sitchensis TaxID=3332 RepID=A9NRS2_PICSI|nr:unknown [Picea sitchensis]